MRFTYLAKCWAAFGATVPCGASATEAKFRQRGDEAHRCARSDDLPVQSVPDNRAHEAENVSDHPRNHDKCDRSERIEWLNEVNRLNHVRPENEIDDWLRPPDRNQERPEQVPAADQRADYQPNFVRISRTHSSDSIAYYCFAASISKIAWLDGEGRSAGASVITIVVPGDTMS